MEVLLQTLAIIASVLGSAYYIHRELKADHKSFQDALAGQTARIDASNTRIDQLHTMFYDLLKEVKK